MTDNSFTEDPRFQQIAEAYALDTVDFARENFGIKLDWSDASIEHIEKMLTTFHSEMATANPSEEQIMQFAKMFGSYVGEVFRKNHGAAWGLVSLGGEQFPGMKTAASGTTFWPWGRVRNRLVEGPEDNVWDYYRILCEKDGQSSDPSVRPPGKGGGFLSKLFGK